jgi:hypothetical protein
MNRVLSFICLGLAVYFFLLAVYSIAIGEIKFTFVYILWGLIFLPQIFQLTSRYGLAKNLIVRIIAFFLAPVFFVLISLPKLHTADPLPTFTPTPELTPIPELTSTPTPKFTLTTPTLIPTPTPELTPTPTSEVDIPGEPDDIEIPIEAETTLRPVPTYTGTQRVREPITGSCECPYDRDRRGRSCGARSAYSRAGGGEVVCYR